MLYQDLVAEWTKEEPHANVEQPDGSLGRSKDLFLFDVDVYTKNEEGWKREEPPPPLPSKLVDQTWGLDGISQLRQNGDQSSFVVMPFAPNKNESVEGRPRHEIVRESIASFAAGVRDLPHLASGIKSYNPRLELTALSRLMERIDSGTEMLKLLQLLSKIAQLAMRLDELITQAIPVLDADSATECISLSQEQAACLLAHAFYCTFPRQGVRARNININEIHDSPRDLSVEKLKFLLAYFGEVTTKMRPGTLSIKRSQFKEKTKESVFEGWRNEEDRLSKLVVRRHIGNEDAEGCLQVDFANRNIGGGVLRHGAVQEEIRFLICPELIVSKLICSTMDATTAYTIIGAQRYSSFSGYSKTTRFVSYGGQEEPRDCLGRARVVLGAMNATKFSRAAAKSEQYEEESITREINKARAAFSRSPSEPARPVATGNWGCGAYNGDAQLKSLLQLMAASVCGRDVIYFPYDRDDIAETLTEVHAKLVSQDVSIG